MPEQQPLGAPPPSPSGSNQYEFFMSPQKPSKRGPGLPGLPSFGGGGLVQRIILVSVGAIILIMLIVIVTSMISSSKNKGTKQLLELAQTQQEVARVAEIGNHDATDASTRTVAVTAKLSVISQQQQLIAYLKDQGIKVNTKQLDLKKDAKVDASLASAKLAGRFDAAFLDLIRKELATYATQSQKAYTDTSATAGKQILAEAYNSTTLLVKNGQEQ